MMRIAVVTGGETAEREVSIRSARNVFEALGDISKELFTFPEDRARFDARVKEFDLVIPVIHGRGGEDGVFQGELDALGMPYIFSGSRAHAGALDKLHAKELAQSLGVDTPRLVVDFPYFAKPRFGGSSVASRLVEDLDMLRELESSTTETEFLHEEPMRGREFTVGVFEYDGETRALPVIEIVPRGEFFDFENKYNPEKLATELCPALISDELRRELQRQALLVHTGLGARHLSRSDFMVTPDGRVVFFEINTIPGMTDTSLIPKMLREEGLSLARVLRAWCEDSLNRSRQ